MRTLTLISALLLAAPSCYLGETRVQQPLSADAVARLEPGRTTAQEVANLLGAPTRVVEIGNGSAWSYEHAVTKDAAMWVILLALRGVDAQSDRIWTFFDASGTLTHVAASFETDRAEFNFPPM